MRSNRETEFTAHLQHRSVLAQNFADEFRDTALPGDFDKAGHQQVSKAAPFPISADGDRIFGAHLVGIGKEMRDAERRPIELGHHCQFAVVVELRQPRRHGVAKPLHRSEEPQPQILMVHMRGEVIQ